MRLLPRAVRAIAEACQEFPRIHLVLVGEQQGGQEDYYNQCLAELRDRKLDTRTTRLRFQEDILSIELAADAIVLCSEGEPLGTAVLEGMALGRPVIVAASGGLPEMIQHEVNGLHCVPGDPSSLATQLCRLVVEPRFAEYLGQNARNDALERFSLPAHGSRLTAIYNEVLQDITPQ